LGADAEIFAEPKPIPLTIGWVSGVVLPVAIVTLEGETVTFVLSLLLSVTVTPPAGAGVPSVIGNAADWLGPTETLAGRLIAPGGITVTLAVTSPTFGRELAWITVVPTATAVTWTTVLVAFAAKFAVAGTVATFVLLELRLMVKPPAGAGDESSNVSDCATPAVMVAVLEKKLSVAVTLTVLLSPFRPKADAVMVADPKSTP
jgi:hypothetical protein